MSTQNEKPVIIGIYGVPGCGKSTMLQKLQDRLGEEHFLFFEGSLVIGQLVEGGLDEFEKMDNKTKQTYREIAIDQIAFDCAKKGKTGVVTGHFMFCDDTKGAKDHVWTERDQLHYTHILYLDVDSNIVVQRRRDDVQRIRSNISPVHVREWQDMEKKDLREICYDNCILLSSVQDVSEAVTLLNDIHEHTEMSNLARAKGKVDEIIPTGNCKPETMLVFDADKTLAAEDTGAIFWSKISGRHDELDTLFKSNMGYSYKAFRQAMLLYEEVADDKAFDSLCDEVASEVRLYPELTKVLVLSASRKHVGAVVVTSGLSCVWEKVLHKYGLSDVVKVIGGGRIVDGYVVTADVKRAVVARLQDTYNTYVWAFGDSVLDLDMLKRADQAIVVVGEEGSRSNTMDGPLKEAIQQDGLRARQLLLPSTVSPRLDTNMLPLIDATNITIEPLLPRRFVVLHATDKTAAKVLMAPMRDASNAGLALRESHRRVGFYLATEYVTEVVGLDKTVIPHVTGGEMSGHILHDEKKTAIIALMRGGEPMAFGVSEAFPLAMFVHAHSPADVKPHHVDGLSTVLLVDSVVNNGKTAVEFVHHIRGLNPSLRIVIVAGVVQAQAISRDVGLLKPLKGYENISLVTLRLSDNKYTGKKGTDTGHRLFNTTHLD